MRFLLSGYYGFGNVGDEALLEVIVSQLRTRHPYAEIDVLSASPTTIPAELRIDSTPRWDVKAVRAAIERADIVLSGGGGLLQNATSVRSLMYYAGIIRTAVRARRTTMIFAQSIGPLDFWGKTIVRETCKGVAAATVRDEPSKDLLGSLFPGLRIERTSDPVFLYDPLPANELVLHGLDPQSSPFAIVNVRPAQGLRGRIEWIARAVDRLTQAHGLRVAFLPLGGSTDAEISTEIIRKCRTTPVLLPETSPAQTAQIIGAASVAVGMRLHALIFAVRSGVPFLSIPYDPKVAALTHDLEYPLEPLFSAMAPPAKMPLDAIDAAVDALWEQRHELRTHLRNARERLEKMAARNFEVLDDVIAERARP